LKLTHAHDCCFTGTQPNHTTVNSAELDVSITTTMTDAEHCNPVSTELPATVPDSAENTPQLKYDYLMRLENDIQANYDASCI